MDFYLLRKPNSEGTPGLLIANDKVFCRTLEDKVRNDDKIPGDTAIPADRYTIVLDWSNRFMKVMPFIRNVKGFEGVLLHGGNTVDDTSGCILCAYHLGEKPNTIWGSAIDDIIALLKKDEINWLEIFTAWPYRFVPKP
jgi:hypothetical protein